MLLQLAFVIAVFLQEDAFYLLMSFLFFVALFPEVGIFLEKGFGLGLLLEVLEVVEFSVEVVNVPLEIV